MNAIIGLIVVSIIFGLLCLINSVAANALFSLFVASNYVAWGIPIVCRLIWGMERFQPGEFYTGKMSRPIAVVAVLWLAFGLVLSMFPSEGPNPTRKFPFFPSVCTLSLSAPVRMHADDGTSRLNELHHRIERIRLAGQHDLLRVVCSQVVHGPEDDGQHERIKAGVGAQRVISFV